mgnify:CR=1 FL=1
MFITQHSINKAIQPFTNTGEFKAEKTIRHAIISGIRLIEKQAEKIDKEVKGKLISKIVTQIDGIIEGIKSWQQWAEQSATIFVNQAAIEITDVELKKWLLHYLLPVFIWALALRRTHLKPKNKKLRDAYQEILQQARDKLKGSNLESHIPQDKYNSCLEWCGRCKPLELFNGLAHKWKAEMGI